MTNTPMTSREAFEQWHKSQYQGYNSYSYKHDTTAYIDDYVEIAFTAWQAGQAQQQAVIAELKRQISAKDSLIDSYREMEADCTKQAQTISELVECLEEILIDTNEGQIMHIASEAIAKVKRT